MTGVRFVMGLSDVDSAETRLGDDPVLRTAVAVVGVAAVVGLAAVDLAPAPLAALDVVLVVAGTLLARWTLTRPGLRWLRLAAWLGVGLTTGALAFASSSTDDPRRLLGALVAGFIAATAAEQDGTRRSTLVNLALGLAVLALAAGVAPGAGLAAPLVVAWVAALVALLRIQPRREALATVAAMQARRGSAGRGGMVRAGLVPIAATLVVGLVAFAVLHALRGEADERARSALGSSGFGTGSDGDAQGDPSPRLGSSSLSGTLDLRDRGALSDAEQLRVPADSPQLWRTGMLDVYTGTVWQESLDGGPVLLAAADPAVDPADPAQSIGPQYVVPERDDDPRPPGAVTRTDRVLAAEGVLVVAAPGVATAVRVPPEVRVLELPDGRLVSVSRQPQVQSDATGKLGSDALHDGVAATYEVTSAGRPDVDALADGSVAAGPDAADPRDPRWTALPDGVPARVRDLGLALASASGNRAAVVRAVEQRLQSTATYTLDSPVPAEGADAVDDFLFVSRKGFCEQFASAEVVLLRAAGIPARLVIGFAGGETTPDGSTRILRGTDAHAWVEVWMPGQGWASSDPTAGSQTAPVGAADAARAWLARWWWAVALAVLVVVASVVGLVIRRRRASAAGEAVGAADLFGRVPRPGEVEVVAAFARLEAALDAVGEPRLPQESLADLEQRLEHRLVDGGPLGGERFGGERFGGERVDGGPLDGERVDGGPLDGGPLDGERRGGGRGLAVGVSALRVLERLTFAAAAPSEQECLEAAAALDEVAAQLVAGLVPAP